MENIPTNPGSTEELLTFAAEIGSSLLIQNRELEEINKNLSLKVENLTNDHLAISNQYQELESINQSLRSRIQFLEEENGHIHNKLKFQIKGENDLKDNLYLQKEREIYQLNSEIEQKDNDIKKAKEKITELIDTCKKQKNEILKLQEDQEDNFKQHIALEKLKDEKKEYRNSIENLELDVSKLDIENNELKESLNKTNEVLNDKNKIITKYNFINTEILKELEKIITNSMNIKQDKISLEKKEKKEEHFLFGIHIDNLTVDIKGDINEMVKCFLDITKLKLEAILYDEITNKEQSEDDNNNVIKSHKYNNNSMSGNDDTIYNYSFDSGSAYEPSISSDEIILDPNFDMNSIYSGISSMSKTENDRNSDIDVSPRDEIFDTLIHENKDGDDENKKISDKEYKIEEKEYLLAIYQDVIKYINTHKPKNSKKINIPLFEKLKLNIRNTYLNLINIIVISISNDKEKKKQKEISDNNAYDIDRTTSFSWLIYPLSLHYYKLLIYLNDIENSIIKKINVNQFIENKKTVKQLKDELNSK